MRGRVLGTVTALLLACSACTAAPDSTRAETPTAGGSAGGSAGSTASRQVQPLPSRAAPDQVVTKLLVFVVENHSLEQMRTRMPYTFGLAQRYGYATDYLAIRHPSLPNYIAITSGDTHGITNDGPPAAHPLDGQSVFGQALRSGRTAAVYADGMTGSCAIVDGGDGYAVRHNPWAYYVSEQADCQAHDQPLTAMAAAVQAGQLPNAGMVVPNLCHDAHDCDLTVADDWIRSQLEGVLAGPDWQSGHLAVVITADEDDRNSDNRVLTVVVHPSQSGHVVTDPLNHYSLSGLYSDVLHAPGLGQAAAAPSMAKAFDLPLQ
jgi:acid phosphatase